MAAAINTELGDGTAFAAHLDVRHEAEWIEVLERANAQMEGLSVLVSSAGIIGSGSIEELSFSDPSHFARFFRKQTGTTPHEFRDRRG